MNPAMAASFARPAEPPPGRRPITVNGVEIPRAAVAREVQNHPADSPAAAWQLAAQALVVRELLLQEARRLDLVADPQADEEGRRETAEEALVRAVVEHAVATPEPDEAACRRYYGANLRRFRSPDLYEPSHILLAADPADADARATARRSAEELIGTLGREPGAFAALARLHSACPSREVGGNLGQIGPGQTVPEFEQALADMTVGTVHGDPVESRYGFHVVRLDRHEEGRQLPFALVQTRIAAYLAEHVRRTAIRQYITVLAGRTSIIGLQMAATDSPLVQ